MIYLTVLMSITNQWNNKRSMDGSGASMFRYRPQGTRQLVSAKVRGGSGPTQLCSRATISQRVTRFFNDFRKVSSNYGRRKAGNGISGLKRGGSPGSRRCEVFLRHCTTVST